MAMKYTNLDKVELSRAFPDIVSMKNIHFLLLFSFLFSSSFAQRIDPVSGTMQELWTAIIVHLQVSRFLICWMNIRRP